jgi:type I restriction enzyme M protein
MELKELKEKTLQIFGADEPAKLSDALYRCVMEGETEKMDAFRELVGDDLSRDWLQMIWQYYNADRKEKKQDYTPPCLGRFMSMLAGESSETVDLCAGSGALTIQRWQQYPDVSFKLYEIDANVIPFLLFNMAIRNIKATVYHANALTQEIFDTWQVRKGEDYGTVLHIESAI